MRTGIKVEVNATDRIRLAEIVADRNSPQKHVCTRCDATTEFSVDYSRPGHAVASKILVSPR